MEDQLELVTKTIEEILGNFSQEKIDSIKTINVYWDQKETRGYMEDTAATVFPVIHLEFFQ